MDAATVMYGRGSAKDDSALAVLGFDESVRAAMLAERETEVWPDNWQAVLVFSAMATQWSVGVAGAVGLRYESLPLVMRTVGVPAQDRALVFEQIQIMERTALGALRG